MRNSDYEDEENKEEEKRPPKPPYSILKWCDLCKFTSHAKKLFMMFGELHICKSRNCIQKAYKLRKVA